MINRKRCRSGFAAGALALLCLAMTACGGGGGGGTAPAPTPQPPPPPPPPPPMTTISVSASAPAPVSEVISGAFEPFDPSAGDVDIAPLAKPSFAAAFSAADQLVYLARIKPSDRDIEINAESTVAALLAYAPAVAIALAADEQILNELAVLPEAAALADYIDSEPDWGAPTPTFEQLYAELLAAASTVTAASPTITQSAKAAMGQRAGPGGSRKVGLTSDIAPPSADNFVGSDEQGGVTVTAQGDGNGSTYSLDIVNNSDLQYVAVIIGDDPRMSDAGTVDYRLVPAGSGRLFLPNLPVEDIEASVTGNETPFWGVWRYGWTTDEPALLSGAAREAYVLSGGATALTALSSYVLDQFTPVPCTSFWLNSGLFAPTLFVEDPENRALILSRDVTGLTVNAVIALQSRITVDAIGECLLDVANEPLTDAVNARIARLFRALGAFNPSIKSVSTIVSVARLGTNFVQELQLREGEYFFPVTNLLDTQLRISSPDELPSFYLTQEDLEAQTSPVADLYTGQCDTEGDGDDACISLLLPGDPPYTPTATVFCSADTTVDCATAQLLIGRDGLTASNISSSIEFIDGNQVLNHQLMLDSVGEYTGSIIMGDDDGGVDTQTFQLQVIKASPQLRAVGSGTGDVDPQGQALSYGTPQVVSCCNNESGSASRTVTLTNLGLGEARVTSARIEGDQNFSVTLGNNAPVLFSQSTELTVSYSSPAEPPAGDVTATLIVEGTLSDLSAYNLVSGGPYLEYEQLRIPLMLGPVPGIAITRENGRVLSADDNGDQVLYVPVTGSTVEETLSIENTGLGTLVLDEAVIEGLVFTLDGETPVTLEPGESSQFTLGWQKTDFLSSAFTRFADTGAQTELRTRWIGLVEYSGNYRYAFLDGDQPGEDCSGTGVREGPLFQVTPFIYRYIYRGQVIEFELNAENGLTTTSTITYAEGPGTTTENLNVTINTDGSVRGTATYTYQDSETSCSGNTIIAGSYQGPL